MKVLLSEIAEKNIRDTVTIALDHTEDHRAMVVYDEESPLAELLARAYRMILPDAAVLRFDLSDPAAILKAMDTLSPGDLVVLIQSTSVLKPRPFLLPLLTKYL